MIQSSIELGELGERGQSGSTAIHFSLKSSRLGLRFHPLIPTAHESNPLSPNIWEIDRPTEMPHFPLVIPWAAASGLNCLNLLYRLLDGNFPLIHFCVFSSKSVYLRRCYLIFKEYVNSGKIPCHLGKFSALIDIEAKHLQNNIYSWRLHQLFSNKLI